LQQTRMGNKSSKKLPRKSRSQHSLIQPSSPTLTTASMSSPPLPLPPPDPEKMIFGLPLHVAAERSDHLGLVPSPVRVCIDYIETRGLFKTMGIYRISGSMKRIQEYISMFNSGQPVLFPENEDVHIVVGVLKAFFRELPEPVFTNQARSEFRDAGDILEDGEKIKQIRRILCKLPGCNRETMKVLIFHLSKIAQVSDENKMTASNLTFSLCPELGSVFTTMIENSEAIFSDLKPNNQKKYLHKSVANCD